MTLPPSTVVMNTTAWLHNHRGHVITVETIDAPYLLLRLHCAACRSAHTMLGNEKVGRSLEAMLERAYLLGFMASGEGWNGEHPFETRSKDPEHDDGWVLKRTEAVSRMLDENRECQE